MNAALADVNSALAMLLDKYSGGNHDGVMLSETFQENATHLPGAALTGRDVAGGMPLLPWRMERRFIELKSLVDNGTLGEISTLRFAAFGNGETLDALLYRELDLCEWIAGSAVKRLYAVASGDDAINVLATLHNDTVASIEISSLVPDGADMIDRHELITTRGVASDRAVDTQVPQNSIYLFGPDGESRFTDTDAELFGMSVAQISLVRAAYQTITHAETGDAWRTQHAHLCQLLKAVQTSISECKRVAC